MSFNYDLNKQDQEVVFSRKLNKSSHPKIFFNNAPVVCVSWQKHLGMFLEEILNFSYHIKEKISKVMKGIGIIKKLSKTLTWYAVITVYKSLLRPQLDYGDIIDDQPSQVTKVSIKKLKEFNAMLLLQLQVCMYVIFIYSRCLQIYIFKIILWH